MKIKNAEWIQFKERLLSMIDVLGLESEKFDLPLEQGNFNIQFGDIIVYPVFTKKPDFYKVEYDFSLCNTQIRTLSLSMYRNVGRIEVSLKNDTNIEQQI